MLVLPVDEDAWAFRACLYVGLALLVLDVVLPRVFYRRVRLLWPQRPRLLWLANIPRARPMDADRFRRWKRELEKQIRALERGEDRNKDSDVATGDESDARRATRKKNKTKTKTRVVLPGDKTETDGENEYVSRRRSMKRVSFDMTHTNEPPVEAVATPTRRSPSTPTVERVSSPVTGGTTAAEPVPRVDAANTSVETFPATQPSARPDPFSLVDDDFPWQLPNYGRMAPAPSPIAPQPTLPVPQHSATLNIRRPLGHVNGPSSTSSSTALPTVLASSSLELKHKPFWKRTPTKERNPSPAKAFLKDTHGAAQLPVAGSVPHTSFASARFGHSTYTAEAQNTEEPQLLFRPDNALRPAPAPQRVQNNPFLPRNWRVPSPKPPLHSRPAVHPTATTTTTTPRMSTPVAPQSKLRTPKIIRRITFDEDMMGALATPSDASPLITESTRKRQRENDVLEALDAVGIPWHKRRLDG